MRDEIARAVKQAGGIYAMAVRVGVDKSTISRWKNGVHVPRRGPYRRALIAAMNELRSQPDPRGL